MLLFVIAAQPRVACPSRRPVSFRTMSEHEEIWLPHRRRADRQYRRADQADDPEIERLVGSPRQILAFRTFAYIRVGVKLGELLVDNDVRRPTTAPTTGSSCSYALRRTARRSRREVRAVADEIAADPRCSEDEQLGPDQAARDRFPFARTLDSLVPDQADEEDRAEAGGVSATRFTDGCSCACGNRSVAPMNRKKPA